MQHQQRIFPGLVVSYELHFAAFVAIVGSVLFRRISLVNSGIVSYFMEELQIHKHFDIFRNFLFLEDGEFALSLSDQLFEKVTLRLVVFSAMQVGG